MELNPLDKQNLMESMDFEDIQKLLGENTPNLIPGEIGRLRLTEALRSQFGDQFRMNATARNALTRFDQETEQAKEILRLKSAQGGL